MLFIVEALQVQPQSNPSNNWHRLDPLLINGKVYDYQKPPQALGSQFFVETGFMPGSLVIDTVVFEDILLNYDVYNQQLVVRFINAAGGTSLLAESQAWLRSFTLEDKLFKLLDQPFGTKRIFQVLGQDSCQLHFYFSKELKLDNPTAASKLYAFGPLKRKCFVKNGSKLLSFKSNAGFLKAFDKAIQPQIKAYLKKHRIKVLKAPDYVLLSLIEFCNTLQQND